MRVAGVALSHPDRVLYADQGITKRALAEFYEGIAEHVLPHVTGRPLSLVRCPSGQGGECFYQKHISGGMPSQIRAVEIEEKSGRAEYVSIRDLPGLIALVQVGVLEIHPWGSRVDSPDRPDRLVFDLDPGPGVGWKRVAEGALEVKEILDAVGLASFVKTSGGKGLHVVVPLQRRSDWDEAKGFARGVAERLAGDRPDRYTNVMSKSEREGRIFVDYLRNTRGATSVAAFSTRARPGAPVSVPVGWDEVGGLGRADRYTVGNLSRRLASLEGDPWDGFSEVRQSLTAAVKKALGTG